MSSKETNAKKKPSMKTIAIVIVLVGLGTGGGILIATIPRGPPGVLENFGSFQNGAYIKGGDWTILSNSSLAKFKALNGAGVFSDQDPNTCMVAAFVDPKNAISSKISGSWMALSIEMLNLTYPPACIYFRTGGVYGPYICGFFITPTGSVSLEILHTLSPYSVPLIGVGKFAFNTWHRIQCTALTSSTFSITVDGKTNTTAVVSGVTQTFQPISQMTNAISCINIQINGGNPAGLGALLVKDISSSSAA